MFLTYTQILDFGEGILLLIQIFCVCVCVCVFKEFYVQFFSQCD